MLELLAGASHVKLLVTSRVALNVRAERRLLLGGLAYPTVAERDEDISGYSAVQLFLASARSSMPHWSLTSHNQEAVVRIYELLQGLPLALEIAGARVRIMNADTIAAEIRSNLNFLESPLQDLPARHRSMLTVFSSSLALLSPAEQRALAKLSVFQGPFSLRTMMIVTGISLATLARLFDHSLVQRTTNGQYEMHGLTRHFAARS